MRFETIKLREDNPNVTLTAYILDDSAEMLNGAERPAVLICPGGGYLYCSDREAEPIAMRFASMGYHAFVLRYSVYYSSYTEMSYDSKLSPKQGVGFPYCIQDMGLAMKYMYEHAEEWKLDKARIALSGFSGGAVNCALYGVYWDKPIVKDFLGVAEGYAPAAMVLGYGVYDNCGFDGNEQILLFQDLNDAYLTALTGEEAPGEAVRHTVSAARLADSAFPPSFLWSTYEDDAVPVRQTVSLADRLIKIGVPVEVHIFESGIHGLSLATQATAMARSNILPEIAVWIDMADRWLCKRMPLPLPGKMMWET